ncbi:uncharacterized protein LOC142226246 [Haematobia irritans]|uniref:uncharacterized protein LOC142226246 n=1 Tax=Haematobia irritans TaxID=7368 RepID=UPI003F50426A
MKQDDMESTTEAVCPVVPTKLLREKIREYTKRHREQVRADTSDSLRFQLGEIKEYIKELDNLSEKDVTGLAARIKRRKHATEEDMYRLSHAFLQDAKNIEVFSKTTGALQVLIKELTGNNAERQISAAECLCNLSLGEAPVCEKISSFTGSYLVTFLKSKESQLVRLSLWTIANILSTGYKGGLILMKMKLLPQLWKMYCNDEIGDPLYDYRVDAALCLQQIALTAKNILGEEDRNFILQHVTDKNASDLGSEYHLQIVFHTFFSHQELVERLNESERQYLLNFSLFNVYNTNYFNTGNDHLKIIYSVRVLSDLLVAQPLIYSSLLQQLSSNWNSDIVALLNKLFAFKNSQLSKESLWLLKNILVLQKQNQTDANTLDKINIPNKALASM